MKRVSIITLHRVKNYGSVLQTYATQEIFEQLGCKVEFVDYWREDLIDDTFLEHSLNSSNWNKSFLTQTIYKLSRRPGIEKNKKIFNGFIDKYINITKRPYYSLEDLKTYPPEADIYCTGSDQVWNSDYNKGILEPFFLEYAPQEKPKIAFSASFGKTQLTEWEKNRTKQLLQRYSLISVRENTGKYILSDLGLEGEHLIDPTLALDINQWRDLIFPPMFKKKYILAYQLNIKNKEFNSYVRELSKRKHLPLVRIGFYPEQKLSFGKVVYRPNVEEFLSLIFYAEYVVTDSFHGTAFSLNFNKKLGVIYPKTYNTRLQSLLKLTGTENRVIKDYNDFRVFDEKINFELVNHTLREERKKVGCFLKRALNLEMRD